MRKPNLNFEKKIEPNSITQLLSVSGPRAAAPPSSGNTASSPSPVLTGPLLGLLLPLCRTPVPTHSPILLFCLLRSRRSSAGVSRVTTHLRRSKPLGSTYHLAPGDQVSSLTSLPSSGQHDPKHDGNDGSPRNRSGIQTQPSFAFQDARYHSSSPSSASLSALLFTLFHTLTFLSSLLTGGNTQYGWEPRSNLLPLPASVTVRLRAGTGGVCSSSLLPKIPLSLSRSLSATRIYLLGFSTPPNPWFSLALRLVCAKCARK